MTERTEKLFLYLHTHWDREWYWAFERYRTQLLSVVRLIVEGLENETLPNFHLDGQACAFDDFLEIEPEFEARIKKLARSKRLSIGPWYVLNDQMLVGGESMIRNLEYGLERSRRFGKPMMVGYCPDTFGHSQDLPRILKGFGIDCAVVWRGVPELTEGPEFIWQSPDGSSVIANLLAKGYHHPFIHEAELKSSDVAIDELVEALCGWLDCDVFSRHTTGALVPVGGDHVGPPLNILLMLEKIKKRLAERAKSKAAPHMVQVEPVLLSEYLANVVRTVKQDAVPMRLIQGELRDNSSCIEHAAGYMLYGVLSARLYLKRENRIAEHRLVRLSEPLYAITALSGLIRYPKPEMENAWKYLLRNQPHDSICGTSVDEVHREMMTRYSSIHQILDVLDRRVREDMLVPQRHEWSQTGEETKASNKRSAGRQAEERVATWRSQPPVNSITLGRGQIDLVEPDLPIGGIAVFNLSCERRSAPVRVRLALPQEHGGGSGAVSGANSGSVYGAAFGSISTSTSTDSQTKESPGVSQAVAYLSRVLPDQDSFQVESVTRLTEVFGVTGGVPDYKDVDMIDAWLFAESIPAMGMDIIHLGQRAEAEETGAEAQTRLEAATLSAGSAGIERSGHAQVKDRSGAATSMRVSGPALSGLPPVMVGDHKISNGFFSLLIGGDGDLVVEVHHGDGVKSYELAHDIIDLGDAGDSYNYDPILNDVPIHARLKSVQLGSSGPLVGSLKLIYEFELPLGIEEDPDGKKFFDIEGGQNIGSFRRSRRMIEHEVTTTVLLKRGVPIVFFESEWTNQSKDHRLQVAFDTGAHVSTTWSENHMSLVERRHSACEVTLPVPKYTEAPLDCFPCQRFFIANAQVFLNIGLPEYSLKGDSVKITLLRATSMLSRKRLLTRGGGAGPYMEIPDGNCIGVNKASYGWAPLSLAPEIFKDEGAAEPDSFNASIDRFHHILDLGGTRLEPGSTQHLSDEDRALAYRLAETYEGTLWTTPVTVASAAALKIGSILELDNKSIRFMALYSRDGGKTFLLRLLNAAHAPQKTRLKFNAPGLAAEQVNLDGVSIGEDLKVVENSSESITYELDFGRNELITLCLKREKSS